MSGSPSAAQTLWLAARPRVTVRPSAEAAERAEHRQDQHRRRSAYDIALRDGAHLGKIAANIFQLLGRIIRNKDYGKRRHGKVGVLGDNPAS